MVAPIGSYVLFGSFCAPRSRHTSPPNRAGAGRMGTRSCALPHRVCRLPFAASCEIDAGEENLGCGAPGETRETRERRQNFLLFDLPVLSLRARELRSRPNLMDPFALRSEPPVGVLHDDGSLDPAWEGSLSDELAVALYEHMVLARTLDERVWALRREGVLSEHTSVLGEEATVVGAVAAMKDEDWVFPSARDVAAALWRGMPLSSYAHHVFGTARDAGKGRSSPDPAFWKGARVASASPLAGTQIPHAVGLAWAARSRESDVAALVFFGEGATSTGDFHTGLNFAGVARAPVVAVCRSHGKATGTPASRPTAIAGVAAKAVAYGLKGIQVDGGDVVAVLNVVRDARQRAAAGLGGTLVEAVIHATPAGAPDGYPISDPVTRMRRYLESRQLWTADREKHLQTEVRSDVDGAVADAVGDKPSMETLFDDVYADLPWHLKEQRGA